MKGVCVSCWDIKQNLVSQVTQEPNSYHCWHYSSNYLLHSHGLDSLLKQGTGPSLLFFPSCWLESFSCSSKYIMHADWILLALRSWCLSQMWGSFYTSSTYGSGPIKGSCFQELGISEQQLSGRDFIKFSSSFFFKKATFNLLGQKSTLTVYKLDNCMKKQNTKPYPFSLPFSKEKKLLQLI